MFVGARISFQELSRVDAEDVAGTKEPGRRLNRIPRIGSELDPFQSPWRSHRQSYGKLDFMALSDLTDPQSVLRAVRG